MKFTDKWLNLKGLKRKLCGYFTKEKQDKLNLEKVQASQFLLIKMFKKSRDSQDKNSGLDCELTL